jgi:cytochrome c-type protein NapC
MGMFKWIGGLWRNLKTPSARWSLGALLGFGIVAGVAGTVSFNTMIHATGTTEFCTSCHSMQAFTLPEFQTSAHGHTRTGIEVTCSDCHIPHSFFPKIVRKTTAGMRDVWGELTGVISTQEKYDAKKWELANEVWAEMKATDSRECRHCHDAARMNPELQSAQARKQHAEAKESGETCIDCHKGVAHVEPVDPNAPATEDEFAL